MISVCIEIKPWVINITGEKSAGMIEDRLKFIRTYQGEIKHGQRPKNHQA
jgi:hypothetical protein